MNDTNLRTGDFVKIVSMAENDYYVTRNGGEPVYGYVYNVSHGSVEVYVLVGVDSIRLNVSKWEVVRRASDEESAEITQWKARLYAELVTAERGNLWCSQWRSYASMFGFDGRHLPPKKIRLTLDIPTDLKTGDTSTVHEVAKAFATKHGVEFAGSAALID